MKIRWLLKNARVTNEFPPAIKKEEEAHDYIGDIQFYLGKIFVNILLILCDLLVKNSKCN